MLNLNSISVIYNGWVSVICWSVGQPRKNSFMHIWITHLVLSLHGDELKCYFNLYNKLKFDLFAIISCVSVVCQPIEDVVLSVADYFRLFYSNFLR